MQKLLLIKAFLVLSLAAKAQVYLTDAATGKPYQTGIYSDIQGSPLLFEDWKVSHATDKYGTTFLDVMIRFDLYNNKFFYNYNGTSYTFVTEITEFELFPFFGDTSTKMIFKKGFTVPDKLTPDKYVQVLAEGKVTAIKYLYKTIDETTEYNVPGKVKNFGSRMTYYFIKDGVTTSQKPNSKLLAELLKDKWAAVDAYMKQNSMSAKNEDDCIRAIAYYNTL